MTKTSVQLSLPWNIVQNPDNSISVVASYNVLDESGLFYAPNTIVIPLTAAQQNTLKNFATNIIIPAIKAKEGL